MGKLLAWGIGPYMIIKIEGHNVWMKNVLSESVIQHAHLSNIEMVRIQEERIKEIGEMEDQMRVRSIGVFVDAGESKITTSVTNRGCFRIVHFQRNLK